MKKFKRGSITLGVSAVIFAMILAACPSTTDNPMGTTFSGIIYADGFSSKLADPQMWAPDGAIQSDYKSFVIGGETDTTNTYNSSVESFKVDWTGITQDWMALAINVGSGSTLSGTVDLSSYNALTFQAKADTSNVVIKEFGFGADGATFTNGEKFKTSLANVTVPSANWKKIIIPLPNATKLTAVNSLFYALDERAKGGIIYLDDIKFENLSDISVKTFEYSGSTLSVAEGKADQIGELTATFQKGTEEIDGLGFTNLAAYATYTSSDPAKATVDGDGKVTGVKAGSTTITGTLGTKTVTVNVTITTPSAFTGTLFDNALQGDFVAKKQAGTTSVPEGAISNAEIDKTIDSGDSGTSGSSIKVDLTNNIWGGGYVQNDAGVDASSYSSLSFDIKLDALDQTVNYLEIKLEDANAGTHSFNLYDLTETATNGVWKTYTIYTENYTTVDFSKFKAIGFWHPKKDGEIGNENAGTFMPGVFHVDNIKFGNLTPTQYTVSYDTNHGVMTLEGSLSESSVTVNAGAPIATPPSGISITGYTLSWNTQKDGMGTDFQFGVTPVNGKMTLYAKWTLNTFAGIIFDDQLNNSFVAKKLVGPGAGTESAVQTDATVFAGSGGSSIKFDLSGSNEWGGGFVKKDAGVDANSYSSLSFDIKLDALDQTVNYLEIKLEDANAGTYSFNLYDLTETATNGDWKTYTVYTTNYSTVDFSKFKALGFWHPKQDGEIGNPQAGTYKPADFYVDNIQFGNLTPTQYTVSYDTNHGSMTLEGSLSESSVTVDDGATIAAPPTGISVTGYSLSWNTQPNGMGKDFQFGVTRVYKVMTLYAKWTPGVIEPTDAPTAPTQPAGEVTSLYSDEYSDISSNMYPGWGGGDTPEEKTIASNKVMMISNYLPFDIGSSQDFSSRTHLHLDVWLPELPAAGAGILIKLVDTKTTQGATGEGNFIYDKASLSTEAWNSIDIELSSFSQVSGTFNLATIDQVVIDIVDDATMYVDNVYFYGNTAGVYTVTYDLNLPLGASHTGALTKTKDENVQYGATIATAPTENISVIGYTLSGWNTAANGGGTPFEFGTTKVTGAITLYAQWTVEVVDSVDNRYYFLGDATDVGTPEIQSSGLTHYPGYDGTIDFTETATGGADGTSNYYILTGKNKAWAAGGWGNGPFIDFTGYDTLVFWAKAPDSPTSTKTAATKLRITVSSRHRNDSTGKIGAPRIELPATSNFTTTWTKYEIPFSSLTVETNFMPEAIYEFKYELVDVNHELHIDEMYLKAGSNTPTLSVTGADFSKDIDESPDNDTVLGELLMQVTYTAGATLSFAITEQNVTGAMSVDTSNGVLKVADNTAFVYASNPQLTATVQVTASNGSTSENANIAVTININDPNTGPSAAPPTPGGSPLLYLHNVNDSAATNWQDWGSPSAAQTQRSTYNIAGVTLTKFVNLGYHGIQLASAQDVRTAQKVHIDIYSASALAVNFHLISTGGAGDSKTIITPTPNMWTSVDINIAEFTAVSTGGVDLSILDQAKFDAGQTDGTGHIGEIWIGNVYLE